MRILVEGLSLFPPRTGIGRYTRQLIEGLTRHSGVESVDVLMSVFRCSGSWQRAEAALRDAGVTCPLRRIPLPYGVLLRLWDSFQRPRVDAWNRYDIVHSPNYVWMPTRKAKSVVSVHDLSLVQHPEWYPDSARMLAPRIMNTLRQADVVIVPGVAVRDVAIKHVPQCEERIRVAPYQMTSQFAPFPDAENRLLRESLFGKDVPFLLWVGEINPRKNVETVIRTLHSMRRAGQRDIRLVLVGPKGYRADEILSVVSECGLHLSGLLPEGGSDDDILLLNYLPPEGDRLSRLYSAAHAFLFPSLDEGFGFPVVEAMAAGTPVLASACGSLPEVAGDAGILHAPLDAEAFAQSAMELMTDDSVYQDRVRAGLARARHYQEIHYADSMVNVYQSILPSACTEPA